MNKAQLIDTVSQATGQSKAAVGETLDAILSTIGSTLASGDEVAITGFGNFKVSQRAARTGRNPATGETIQIAASSVPGFKAGSALKKAVGG